MFLFLCDYMRVYVEKYGKTLTKLTVLVIWKGGIA